LKRIHVPEAFIYSLLAGNSNGYRIKRTSSFKIFEEYLIPPKNKLARGFVDLKPLTIIGFMSMGKTVFAAHVTRKAKHLLKKRFNEELFSVSGKSIVDVVEFLKNNKDLYQDRKAMLLFLDDIFYQGLSTERSKAKSQAEKYYSDIRHKFEELGFNNGVLYILFAGQRLKLIPPFFRSSPMLVFKPLLTNDKYERQVVLEALTYTDDRLSKTLAELSLAILETAAKIIYTKWDDRVKSLTIVKPGWDYPFIYIQDSAPNPKTVFDVNVPFNYSGIYEEQDEEQVEQQMSQEAKKILLKYITAAVKIGMIMREYGIGELSVKLAEKTIREVLHIGFNQNLLTRDFIETAYELIDKKALFKLIDTRTPRAVILEKHF
jgi:hypothetical protein